MLKRAMLAAVLVTVAAGTASAQLSDEARTELDAFEARRSRFGLFNECSPVLLITSLVGDEPDVEAIDGLTQDRLQMLAEVRLRAARLYHTRAGPYLFVRVQVSERLFSTKASFHKILLDEMTGLRLLTESWHSEKAGTHGRDADYILQAVSDDLDAFILQYLRVNEAACGGP